MNRRPFKKYSEKRPDRHGRKQPMPEAVLEELLRFIQAKFYPANSLAFTKDRPRLLRWVIFKLATYLEERGVTIQPAQYLEIMRDKILMEAVRHQAVDIEYVPAWLGKTVETHLDHHGEDYYEAAKTIRNAVDGALAMAHGAGHRPRDVVREFSQAARLLKPRKAPINGPEKKQLTLL